MPLNPSKSYKTISVIPMKSLREIPRSSPWLLPRFGGAFSDVIVVKIPKGK